MYAAPGQRHQVNGTVAVAVDASAALGVIIPPEGVGRPLA